MVARFAQSMGSFQKRIATRSLAPLYAWIAAGLEILYLVTFPSFQAPILVAIPVALIGWFYYRKGGFLASILAFALNLFLYGWAIRQPKLDILLNFKNGFLIDHLFVVFVGTAIGYLREVFENLFRLNEQMHSQARFLSLSNMIVRKILAPSKLDRLYDDIVNHLTNLFVSDRGCLLRWDQIQGKAFLVTATNPMESLSLGFELSPDMVKLIEDILETGQALIIEEITNSPYAVDLLHLADPTRPIRSAICFPLAAREYKFGTAILSHESPHHYTEEDKAYAERIGYQIALALWTVKQDEISQQQLIETRTLMQTGQALSETERVGLEVVLQLIVDSARQLIPQAEKSVIHLVDIDNQFLVPQATSGFSDHERLIPNLRMHIGHGAAGQVLRDGVTINITDITTDARFVQMEIRPSYCSLLVAPVQTAGKRLGTISVESAKTHAFSEHGAELLKALGNQAAIAIENTRLFESTQQRLKEVNALYRISQGLAVSLDADQLIQDVLTMLQQDFGYYYVQIFLLDPATGDLVFQKGSNEVGHKLSEQRFRVPRGNGIIGYVSETGTPFVTNNVNNVVFFSRNPLLPNTQAELAVPIKVEGKAVGVLDIQHEPPHWLTDGDLQLMTAVADQLAVALQKASLYADLQKALQQEQTMRSHLVQSERLALMGKLLASVSHELNNPLQTIQNALFLIRDELEYSGIRLEEMDIIGSEMDRMVTLLNRLRSTYRPLHPEEFRPVHINNIVEDVYKLVSTHLRHKNISFEFHPDPYLPAVKGIADHLKQVVLNLFINAVEAMPDGGHLCVDTAALVDQDEMLLSIMDNGTGITPELLPKIFDPFVTNKETGTGLGLTITHEIVGQHQGRVQAENLPAGGAKFTVWFPIWKETSE